MLEAPELADPLRLEMTVSERLVPLVKTGQPVSSMLPHAMGSTIKLVTVSLLLALLLAAPDGGVLSSRPVAVSADKLEVFKKESRALYSGPGTTYRTFQRPAWQ